MNKLKLFKAVDLIDNDLIREADMDSPKTSASGNADTDRNITVSGVDVYRVSKWQKFALIAAAFLLVAGIGAGGALMLKNRPPMLEDNGPALPSDISETDSASPFEHISDKENATAAVKTTAKAVKTTKESSNIITTVSAAQQDTAAPTVTTDSDTLTAEINKIYRTTSSAQEQQSGVEDFVSRAKEFPVVTTPDGNELPISPMPTGTTVPQPTEPVEEPTQIHLPNQSYDDEPITFYPYTCPEMFEIVRSLSYTPITCDGLPDTSITDSDGTVYQLNFRERWVWRNGAEEAYMPDRLYQLFCGG